MSLRSIKAALDGSTQLEHTIHHHFIDHSEWFDGFDEVDGS
jgi:hypothetical protein